MSIGIVPKSLVDSVVARKRAHVKDDDVDNTEPDAEEPGSGSSGNGDKEPFDGARAETEVRRATPSKLSAVPSPTAASHPRLHAQSSGPAQGSDTALAGRPTLEKTTVSVPPARDRPVGTKQTKRDRNLTDALHAVSILLSCLCA